MYTDIPNGNSAAQLASDAGHRPQVKDAPSHAHKAKPRDCFVDHCFGEPILGTPSPLPCPFCGSVAMVSIGGPGGEDGYNGDCSNCGAEGPVAATELEAALLWNRRPGERARRSSRGQTLSRAARLTLRQLAAMRSYQVSVTGHAADRRAALLKVMREISGEDLRSAKEALRTPWGFCYACKTAEEANALQRKLVAAGAVCTVKYVDAYGNPVEEGGTSHVAPHIAKRLAEKCGQARALMEQAQALIEEVLEPDALPYGICPDGVDLGDAIGMLIPELRLATG